MIDTYRNGGNTCPRFSRSLCRWTDSTPLKPMFQASFHSSRLSVSSSTRLASLKDASRVTAAPGRMSGLRSSVSLRATFCLPSEARSAIITPLSNLLASVSLKSSMPTRTLLPVFVLLAFARTGFAAEKVDFGRDIRPILSDKCFKCHGPATQKAKLRLDDRDAAISKEAITPGKHATSELIARVLLDDNDPARMPPPEIGDRLTPDQVAKLKAWIDQGADYPPHWAFVPPKRPPFPLTLKPRANAHPIDAFIRARLVKESLQLSPEADRTTLIRRVTLDLTGLLPVPEGSGRLPQGRIAARLREGGGPVARVSALR